MTTSIVMLAWAVGILAFCVLFHRTRPGRIVFNAIDATIDPKRQVELHDLPERDLRRLEDAGEVSVHRYPRARRSVA